VRALDTVQNKRKPLRSYNPVPLHCYAAKFGDDLVRQLLLKHTRPNSTVLDPFAGSGTTLIQAKKLARNAIGIDVDPIACLISRVQLRQYSKRWLTRFRKDMDSAIDHLQRSLRIANPREVNPNDLFQVNGFSAQVPASPEINYWFSKNHRRILAALVSYMRQMSSIKSQELFALAISASIIRKWPNTLSRAMDIDHSRPHRTSPIQNSLPWGFKLFKKIIHQTVDNLESKLSPSRAKTRMTKIFRGDCIKKMRGLRSASIDCVLTSPPYINAIDYPRAHKYANEKITSGCEQKIIWPLRNISILFCQSTNSISS
jgi:hypothetical protein